jgi:hypothetical protein
MRKKKTTTRMTRTRTTTTSKRKAAWLAAALLAALAAAWFPPPAAAQQPAPYALIFGTVYDGGRPVHGVEVKIRRADKKRPQWRLYSDRRGEFAQRLPAGKAEYVVWAVVKRKKSETKALPEVRVAFENDERKDISLHLSK